MILKTLTRLIKNLIMLRIKLVLHGIRLKHRIIYGKKVAMQIQSGEPIGTYVYEVQSPNHYLFTNYPLADRNPILCITNFYASILKDSLAEDLQPDNSYKGEATAGFIRLCLSSSRMPVEFENELETLLKDNDLK